MLLIVTPRIPARAMQDTPSHVLSPAADLRFYARGAFSSPLLTLVDGTWKTWYRVVKPSIYGTSVVLHSLVDYPVRRFSGGRYGSFSGTRHRP